MGEGIRMQRLVVVVVVVVVECFIFLFRLLHEPGRGATYVLGYEYDAFRCSK